MSSPHILLIEDNASDVWMICNAIQEAGISAHIETLTDGEQGIRYIAERPQGASQIPLDLIILDLNLPRHSGHEIIQRWKTSGLSGTPILVVTSSDSPRDREAVQQFTPHYFRKPLDYDEFLKLGQVVQTILAESPISETPSNVSV